MTKTGCGFCHAEYRHRISCPGHSRNVLYMKPVPAGSKFIYRHPSVYLASRFFAWMDRPRLNCWHVIGAILGAAIWKAIG